MSVGSVLRRLRTEESRWAGVGAPSPARVAYELGVSESSISRRERGEQSIPVGDLARWLDLLRASDEERLELVKSVQE